jgi:GNAT superfamily N-acetyltransferase
VSNWTERAARLQSRIAGRLRLGLHTKLTRYGLARILSVPISRPTAKIPLAVRRLESRDIELLFSTAATGSDPRERWEAAIRQAFIEKGANLGYVAVDERNGTPCYVQWLFGAHDNEFVQKIKGLPVLQPHQALVENVYTLPSHRGLGIMSAAMALIAERAADFGATEVLVFVGTDNIASLKGCQRAGFNPVMLHHSTHMLFGTVRSDTFTPLADGDPRRAARV